MKIKNEKKNITKISLCLTLKIYFILVSPKFQFHMLFDSKSLRKDAGK